MGKVAVVTSSMACLPQTLVDQYQIHIIRPFVVWGGESFRDGADLTPTEFYHLLRESKITPTTATPSLGEFVEAYEEAGRGAEAVVAIYISRELSYMYELGGQAAREISSVPVQVIDSRSIAMAMGFVVLAAARAAGEGAGLQEVIEAAQMVIGKVNLFFVLDTLEYLHRGGRIGGAAALVGSVIQLKPILYLREGKIDVLEKPRTKGRAVRRMVEIMAERAEKRPVHASILHADALEKAQELRDVVASRFDCLELYITDITPVVGVHTGPGTLGLAFYTGG